MPELVIELAAARSERKGAADAADAAARSLPSQTAAAEHAAPPEPAGRLSRQAMGWVPLAIPLAALAMLIGAMLILSQA